MHEHRRAVEEATARKPRRTQTGNDDIVMIYWSIFLFYLDFTIIVPGVHHQVLRRPLHGLRLRPLPRRGDPHGQALQQPISGE